MRGRVLTWRFGHWPVSVRCGLAVATAIAVLASCRALEDSFQGILFSLPIATVALLALGVGAGPGLLATVLMGVALWYFFQPPQHSFALANTREVARLLAYFVASLSVLFAIDRLARIQRRLAAANALAERGFAEQRAQAERLRVLSNTLREERDFIAAVLDTTASLVLVLDSQGRIRRTNRACEEVSGYTTDELGRMQCTDLIPDGERANVLGAQQKLAAGEFPIRYQAHWRTRNGALRLLDWSSTVLLEPDGSVRFVVATGTDVTERARAEAELRHAAEVLDLGDAYLEVDADYRIVRVNAHQERLSRTPRSQSVGRIVWDVWPEAASPESKFWLEFRRCMQERVPGEFEDYYAPLDLWASANAYPTTTGGLAVFIRDITPQKRAEQALREADQRKNEFLAVLSHELRNPLAPISNSLYTLERAAPGGPQAKTALEVISRQIRHMARLVDDLLDVTRISRGKVHLQLERVELGDLVRRTAEDHRSIFSAKGVRLELADLPGPIYADGDPTRLSQVIGNLLGNAVKFTPQGGRVQLSLRFDPSTAEIRVRDDGAGLAPNLQERLFAPFVQADVTLDRSKGGLGLGLALVKGLVELHGGSVSAHSEGPGHGAEFIVRLPARAERPSPSAASASSQGRPMPAFRVLVIEDNLDAAESLKDALEMNGHQVEIAGCGKEGLEKARHLRPDVILCDIGLPGMDGFEVARQVRADPELHRSPMVALSGYAAPQDLERSKAAGFNLHLTKPPSIGKLESTLSQLWEQARTA